MNKYDILKEYFGHDSFREGQEQLVDAVLSNRDVLGIMPTGAGKSMCYQIPSLLLPGVAVVVSPLISLMKDQVNSLIQSGVKAAYLNSSLSREQYETAISNARRGQYKIIYVAPERLCTPSFLSFASNVKISVLAVDEAHCVSQWGQDFRPSYMKIPEFIGKLSYRPTIAAFTATATAAVKDDIIRMLELHDPCCVTTGFDRKNLYFEVRRPSDKFKETVEILERNKGKSGIIYCSTRKNVEEVCQRLCEKGYSCSRYHAGLSDEERRRNQDDFIYDRVQIIAATNAFGMGIDKSNVSFVIHYNMPKNIESYYQEAGRAGRDGEPAECILLYSGQDVRTNTYLINNSNDNPDLDDETVEELRRRDLERLRQMTFYCTTSDCLRGFILKYFGERAKVSCANCSNCNMNFEEYDVTVDAQKILSCVFRLSQRRLSFGAAMTADILKGSKSAKITKFGLETLSTYGIMKDAATVKIRRMIDVLEDNGYIKRVGEHSVLALTKKAGEILFDGVKLTVKMPKETPKEKAPSKQSGAFYHIDAVLLERLKKLRSRLASEAHMPAYIIFTDNALRDMCVKLPTTSEQLLNVSGIGKTKQQRYGAQVLRVIKDYLKEKPRTPQNDGAEGYLDKIRESKEHTDRTSMLFKLIRLNSGKLKACDEELSLGQLCDRILDSLEISADRSLLKKTVADWLVQNNYLKRTGERSEDLDLTILSEEAGIIRIEKTSKLGTVYTSLAYPKDAQEFLIENLNEIFS